MYMLILFPSCPLRGVRHIETDYANEYEAVCRLPEFKTILFDYDKFVAGEGFKLYPNDVYTGECIYRGWMLTPEQYLHLYEKLLECKIQLINTPQEYDNLHLFPLVYPHIKKHTSEILIYHNVTERDMSTINKTFSRFMVKDFVKSVKGHDFPAYFETPINYKEFAKHLARFNDLRGKLFTGGYVIKGYLDLKKYGNCTNEYRAFYLNGEVLSICRNSGQQENCPYVPSEFVIQFADLSSNFYTVDFAELNYDSRKWVVLETGDGQVSGLSQGQWEFKFYDDMRVSIAGIL